MLSEVKSESPQSLTSMSEATAESGAVSEFSAELSHIIDSALKRQSMAHRAASRTPTRDSITRQTKSPIKLNAPMLDEPDLELEQLTSKVR